STSIKLLRHRAKLTYQIPPLFTALNNNCLSWRINGFELPSSLHKGLTQKWYFILTIREIFITSLTRAQQIKQAIISVFFCYQGIAHIISSIKKVIAKILLDRCRRKHIFVPF